MNPLSNINSLQIGSPGFSPTNYVRANPEDAASLSKMTTGMQNNVPSQARGLQTINTHLFRQALLSRAKRNTDNELVMRLLPDLELASQIVTSSILSPKDMSSTSVLNYSPGKRVFKNGLEAQMLEIIREHFRVDYPFQNELYKIVEDSLIKKGSKPIIVLPENAIDSFINHGTTLTIEHFTNEFSSLVNKQGELHTIGLLGGGQVLAPKIEGAGLRLESHYTSGRVSADQSIQIAFEPNKYESLDTIQVIDNPAIFSMAKLNDITRSTATHEVLQSRLTATGLHALTMENISVSSDPSSKMSIRDIERSFYYRNRPQRNTVTSRLPTQDELTRKSVGKPLVMHLPPESVMPVHEPGNPKKQIGLFVMLDQNGYAVEIPDGDIYNLSLGAGGSNDSRLQSSLIKRVEANMGGTGSFDVTNREHTDQAANIFSELIERDLINRVRNGVHGQTVSIANLQDVSRIMLARTLAKKQTQLLYVPAEYMTYIAFDYDDKGMGRSILDTQASINAQRVALLFAEIMSAMKNSIGRTRVNVTMDQRDTNVNKSLEVILDEIVRSRSFTLPLNGADPYEIMNQINRAGYIFNIKGHRGLPDMEIDFQEVSSQHQAPDDKLRDSLKAASAMGFGVPPEMIAEGYDPKFATTAVNDNILMSKRILMRQQVLAPQLTDHLRKYARADETLISKCKELIEANPDELELTEEDFPELKDLGIDEESKRKFIAYRALQQFITTFNVSLPEPSQVTESTQKQELQDYSDLLDAGLEQLFNNDAYPEALVGKLASHIGTFKAVIKSNLMREELNRRGILPELVSLTNISKDSKRMLELLDELKNQTSDVSILTLKFLAMMKPMAVAADNDLIKNKIEEGQAVDDGGGYDEGGGDGGGMGDDLGGMDMNTGGDDMPLDEPTDTPAEETTEEPADAGGDEERDATNNDNDPTAP